jgi:hypothetical protein
VVPGGERNPRPPAPPIPSLFHSLLKFSIPAPGGALKPPHERKPVFHRLWWCPRPTLSAKIIYLSRINNRLILLKNRRGKTSVELKPFRDVSSWSFAIQEAEGKWGISVTLNVVKGPNSLE